MKPIELTEEQLTATEEALTGPTGEQLMQLMRTLSIHQVPSAPDPGALDLARALGWIDTTARAPALTDLGAVAADPLRELVYWRERAGRMPGEDAHPQLCAEAFAGKKVLEIGSGFGCNLLSLQEHAAEVAGVDMVPLYLQLGPILARLVDRPAPAVMLGHAEALPVEDASFDAVLCIGALQYMDIEHAVAEMGRVLRPGGDLLLLQSHFLGHLRIRMAEGPRLLRPRAMARLAIDVAGMLAYPYVGRAFTAPHTHVYPTHRRLRSWLSEAGLDWDPGRTRVSGNETCYLATKRA